MATETSSDDVPLPRDWPARVKSAILQVISLANLAIFYSRSWAANSVNARVRLQAKLEQSRNDVSLLQEEIRIKDARMAHLDAHRRLHRRPHYRPMERLAILELKAARGWSAAQTARTFLVEPDTRPQAKRRKMQTARLTLTVRLHAGRRELPIVELKRAA